MKTRFIIIVMVIAAAFVSTMYLAAGSLSWFIDLPSFALAVVLPVIVAAVIFSPGRQRRYFLAVFGRSGAGAEADSEDKIIGEALLFFKTLSSLAAVCTAITILIGLISILGNVRNNDMIGSGLAVMLLAPLYCLLLFLIVIIPCRTLLLRRKEMRTK